MSCIYLLNFLLISFIMVLCFSFFCWGFGSGVWMMCLVFFCMWVICLFVFWYLGVFLSGVSKFFLVSMFLFLSMLWVGLNLFFGYVLVKSMGLFLFLFEK